MGRVNWASIFPFTCYPCGAFGVFNWRNDPWNGNEETYLNIISNGRLLESNLKGFFFEVLASSKNEIVIDKPRV